MPGRHAGDGQVRKVDRLMNPFLAIGRDQRGNSVIELALVAPLLASLFIGMVDISRAVSSKVTLEQAAQRAIERAQARDFKTSDESAIEADAEAAAGSGSNATVDAWLECNHDGVHLDFDAGTCGTGVPYARYVKVSITNTFTPLFGTRFFPGANANGSVNVNGQATLRVQ
jgi:Flp pilus assembly protein TadG